MPFGLINAGATFQRAMDIAFQDLIGKCIIIYMDDITIFSRKREDHIEDLRKVFQRCRKYGISLNPKKCIFGVTEGKLLGHIISEKGISIDPERVEAISKINLPSSKKELRSFFGKINFVREFISGFAEIIRPLNEMLKKDAKIDWTTEAKKAFEEIKSTIVEAPVLVSPDYARPFYVYSFSSEHTCAAVLTQKNEDKDEHPIAFMSAPLKDAELRYPNVEKQAYALNELGERRGKWIATIQEYDIEIQPMRLVRGQALAQTLAVDGPRLVQQVYAIEDVTLDEWYKDIVCYLLNHRCPAHMAPAQKRALRLKCQHFMLQGSVLYRRNHEGIYLRCVGKNEAKQIVEQFHNRFGTGHGASLATAHQILRAGYYWSTLFRDTHEHVKTCHTCQVAAVREKNPAMLLQPVIESRPFAMWGIDFIGMINPPSSAQHRYILTATDYCTWWSEAQALKLCTIDAVIKFLEENIITRFGCPHAIGNGLAESTNKNLLSVIKKLLEKNLKDWHTQLRFTLWADRTRVKNSLGTSPYFLVYGQEPVFPVQLRIPTLRFIQDYMEGEDGVQMRLTQLMNLEEKRDKALENFAKHQSVVKRWFDRQARVKAFRISDLVLYWGKAHERRGDHDKFDKL
ncbi:uncharacterized protein LOC131071404 [Cryptomeria japonica]|uniref:uncharacterized protein LOC131071404 n=1 Tax=Cryptomeria japonica TaxID=3369 RepID=UPI0025AB8E43|nr:uncharacterized protein LOC131071404 [Cryptomeria japonica]